MSEASATPAARPSPLQPVLMTQSLLFALTPLIPVPFVGDACDAALRRAIARGAAASVGIALSDAQLQQLTDHPSRPWWRDLLGGLLWFPMRWILRTALVVRQIKSSSDRVSVAYHRGYLLSYAAHVGHLNAESQTPLAAVRRAIDRSLSDDAVSPLANAWRVSLRGAQEGRALHLLQAMLTGVRRNKPQSAAQADEAVAQASAEAAASADARPLLQRFAAAIRALPDDHFERLIARYEANL